MWAIRMLSVTAAFARYLASPHGPARSPNGREPGVRRRTRGGRTARAFVARQQRPPTARGLRSGAVREPGLVGEHDGLDAVAQAELGQQPRDVRLDRRFLDGEQLGDLGVGEALRDEFEHLE